VVFTVNFIANRNYTKTKPTNFFFKFYYINTFCNYSLNFKCSLT
jgi:hypothetical protein